jgi:hypothetical protein
MTDREKLFRLLLNAFSLDGTIGINWNDCSLFFPNVKFKEAIDYLLENGVTVKQMQKPLTVENLIFFNWEIWCEWWIELKSGRLFCAKECEGYIHTPKDEYGKTWRCWKEKPTDEERQAAEWEK